MSNISINEVKLADKLKLGKKQPKWDPRTLQFAKYVKNIVYPKSANWGAKATYNGMYLNDRIGDCTIAGIAHLEEVWTGNVLGKSIVTPDSAVLKGYIDVTGMEGGAYDPKTGRNDNGCYELDVLNYWKKVGINGRKIAAYVSVNPRNFENIKKAIYLFGGVYIGIELPITAQTQKIWKAVVSHNTVSGNAAPGSWGGHCTILDAYDANYMTNRTWAELIQMTYGFTYWYVSECYAVLSQDWINTSKISPSGFNYAQLSEDLQYLTGKPLQLKIAC